MSAKENLDPITPGEILREDFMQPLGISINRLSRDLFVPPNRISEIVKGKRSITVDTALRLQRYFGIEAQFWLNLQTEFDLRMIRRKIWSDIERRIIPVKTIETGIEHDAGAYRDRNAPHRASLQHHRTYGSVYGDSADQGRTQIHGKTRPRDLK